MATKSTFNIPIKDSSDSYKWANIQFQTTQENVNGLSSLLNKYVDITDTQMFTKEGELKVSVFPDQILGQLPYLGSIIPLGTKDTTQVYYVCQIKYLTDLGKTLIKNKIPLLDEYENFYLTQGSPKDDIGDSFSSESTIYIGYKDLPAGYFSVYLDKNDYPSGVYIDGFLGLNWYIDDWCVPTSVGFSHITNQDAVTSVNNQTYGNICTYGGAVQDHDQDEFWPGTFYLFGYNSVNRWYPQYPSSTTEKEINSSGEFLAMCITQTPAMNIKWDTVESVNGMQTLVKGDVDKYFISSAKKDYTTTNNFKLPYTDITGNTMSNVVDVILNDFGDWILQIKRYYDNSLPWGYSEENYLYESTDNEKIKKLGGLAKGIAISPNYEGHKWSPLEEEKTIPKLETTNSTIKDYKFYIEFKEDPSFITN